MKDSNFKTITLGAGCFWCIEAVFRQLKGIKAVKSGYANGHSGNATYREVCTGTTGYVEVAQIEYDRSIISLEELLEVFWSIHDPTTPNRQGNDIGTQYRSGIYYEDKGQKLIAEKSKDIVSKSGLWSLPIVTEIMPLNSFFIAENYHQDYYELNKNQPYCTFVVKPKLIKIKELFQDKLKTSNSI